MAITVESSNRVWQRVKNALLNGTGSNEASVRVLLELKKYLATFKGNPQLQFVSINGATSASDSGNTASNVLCSGACTLYALYLKKTGATACWFKGSNHASTASTDGTQPIAETSAVANDEICRVWPNGKALGTGLSITQNTTATGSTLTLNANRFDGFVIIG